MKKEMKKGSFLLRRALAVVMVMMLVVSIVVPNIVWAEETNTTTNGYYDALGEWHQGGDGTLSYPDANLTLSKTAKPVEGLNNIFEITLSVSLKQSSLFSPSSIATVLVIDVSGSMRACEECQSRTSHELTCSKWRSSGNLVLDDESRLHAAKQAAIAFIDEMRKNAKEDSEMYVNLVSFSDNAIDRLSKWQDVTTTDGYNAVKNAIEGLSVGGGTNLDGGLGHAIELINDEEVSSISKSGKNVIVLTDGEPTYYMDTNGTRQGNGTDCTETMLEDTVLAATELKSYANLFTICYNASTAGTYAGGPTVGKFLEDRIATPATSDITYAYDADSSISLVDSFMSIIDIAFEGTQITITDQMPENISISEGDMPDGVSYVDGIWSLDGVEPTEKVDGDFTIYTYTIVYRVEIDAYANGMEEGKFYPANQPTKLVMEDGTTYEFPVPGIMPIPTKYDVTFNSGEHGSIEGEDENGDVTYEIISGKDTPDAPEVTPDDGWYFVGWTPEISDTVEDDVTYTAIYSQKQVITVTGNSNTVTYSGSEQSVSGFSVSGLPTGWTVSGITYSASGTNASATPYAGAFSGTPVVKNENGEIVPVEQYTLVIKEGGLTIEKRDLTITADSNSKEYDGTALTDNGWEDTAPTGLVSGDEIVKVTVTGSQTLVGSSANVASGAVVMNGNNDVADNYNIIYVDGTLTVTKNTNVITITANSASKIYDGTPLTDSGYTYTQGILASGDVLTATVQGSQTNAGTGVNQVVSWTVMRGDIPVTQYYTIAFPVAGTLTVEKRDLTITADSASKIYDGTPLTDSGWNDTKPVGVAYGDSVTSVTVTGSQLGVGTSYNVASNAVVMRGDKNVTSNYNIIYVDGKLTVSQVGTSITITADSSNKIYDGLPLKDSGFTFTQGVLADGDVLLVEMEGSQTDVGTSANVVASYKVIRGNEDVTHYYNFTAPVDGTLTVEKRTLTITADSNSKEYDGTELWDYGWKDTAPEGLAATDEIYDVIVEGSQLGVGTSANVASDATILRGERYVTDNYNIIYVDGTLTVTKNTQVITITAESDSKVYDGTPLTNDGYTFTDGILAYGDELVAVVEGSQTYVGTSANKVVSYKVMNGFEDVTSYYTFATPVDGTLTVTKVETPIIVEANSSTKEYDGTPLTDDGYYFDNYYVLANGDELVAVIEGSQTYVGSSANKVVSVKVMRGDKDVTENYTIGTPVDGTLTVTKVETPIVIEANSDIKEYDGTPLTNNGFCIAAGEYLLADGDEVVAVIEGSQTYVGTSENKVVSYKVMNGDKDVTDCYTLDISDGTLTVTKVAETIVIEANSDSKEYDGTPLTNSGYTFTQGVLVDGDVLTAVIEGSQTYVGTSVNEVVSYKVMRGDRDVTDSYEIETYAGILEVTPKANTITITAVSDSKEYDGTALVNGGYSFTQGILADGDILTVDVNGSQTFVGTGYNIITSYKVMRGETDVTDNYAIVTVDGTLTVTKRDLVITADSAGKAYDGTALKDNGWNDIAPAGLANGDTVTRVTVTGSRTEVGQSANVASGAVVMRGDRNVTSNYNIIYVDGTLTVSRVGTPIIITANSDSKVYDGTALTNGGFTFTQGVLAQNDKLVVVVEGSQTNAGIGANKVVSYKVMRGNVDVTTYYTFGATVDGTLTVEKRDVTIIAGSGSKEYDGTVITNDSCMADGIVTGEYIDSVTVVGSQLFAGSSANVASNAVIMGSNGDTTANYNITYVDGTLTVTKRTGAITVTADSDSKEYDGTPLTNDGFTFTGELADGDEIVVVIEGSQTFVGSSDNKLVSVKVMRNGADVTDNYTTIASVDGTLTVTKRTDKVTITAGSDGKIYDGTPLTNDSYTVTGELADGDEIVVVIEGSQTFAGSSANTVVSYKVIRDGVDVTDNYANLVPVDGTLTIEKIETPIIITAGSNTKPYDGTPLTDGTFTFTDGVLIDGDEIVVIIEGSQTEVGSSANKVVSIKVMRGEIDVTDSYNIELPVDGELVITPVVPDTGDNSNITVWNVMMLVSVLTLFVLAITSRKRRAR